MKQSDIATREIQAPRGPASTLRAAILSINATIDLETVPGEEVESTFDFTGTRNGVIVALADEGTPHDPAFSGLTPGAEREQPAWPGNAACSSTSAPCRGRTGGRLSGLRPHVRHRDPLDDLPDLSEHADARPGQGSLQLLPRREGG